MHKSALLNTIHTAWGWTGVTPAEIVATNSFGNVIVREADSTFWRICPEELSCQMIAPNAEAFESLFESGEFARDWQMSHLVDLAMRKLGNLSDGQCYCLKIPAVLGGGYDEANLGTTSVLELISCSGFLAAQIKDVPDCAAIRIKVDPQ